MTTGKVYRQVGIAQIYPWRPHAAQRDYLIRVARESGHAISELVCHGSSVSCYDKQYQTLGWGGVDHCIKCRLGARKADDDVRSFKLDWSTRHSRVEGEQTAMLSNRAAVMRAELTEDITEGPGAVGLLEAYRVGYHSTLRWIDEFGVDLILLFNGRIDILRGVMDAARCARVDFASYERSWFGDGIMLIPNESCLGLGLIQTLAQTAATIDLSEHDIAAAETVIRRRVERLGSNEWRDFQVLGGEKRDSDGGVGRSHEVLVLPSSMYEIWGHPDWTTSWRDNFEALDWLQARIGVPWSRWLIRGHPIWSQRVGKTLGSHAERRYRDFCTTRGIRYIESGSSVHTSALIDASDLVVINGGSSVIDAVWRGKPVISLSESAFHLSGICPTALSSADTIDVPDDATRRKKLVRFVHAMDRLMPTFVNHLVAISPAEQSQHEGGRFQDVIDQIRLNTLLVPGKNEAPVGDLLASKPTIVERARHLLRMGDQ